MLKFLLVAVIAFASLLAAVHTHPDGVSHENCLICVLSTYINSDDASGIAQNAQVDADTTDLIIHSAVPVTENLLFCLWPHAPPLS